MEDKQIMKAITPRVRQLMAMAAKAAEATGDNYIGLEHIEIAISQFRIEKARPGSTVKYSITQVRDTSSDWALPHAKKSYREHKTQTGREGKLKYKVTPIYEQTRSGIRAWVEGYSYRPSSNQWENGFVPTHPEHGEEWAFKEACRRAKECACAIIDGEEEAVQFEVVVEREDMPLEDLEKDEYEIIDSDPTPFDESEAIPSNPKAEVQNG